MPSSAANTARLMHHHLPTINNLNFSHHDLLQAHHAMQSISRQHFNQFRINEHRLVNPLPFHQPPIPPPPHNHNLMPPPLVPPQMQMNKAPHLPPHPPPHPISTMSRVSSTVTTTTNANADNNNIYMMPEITLEKNIPKEYVEELLREGKATVVLETGKRTRSDVWMYMGRVKIGNSGFLCQDVVACAGCNMVYLYKSKSQGTSTLRHHKCHLVFQMLQEKERIKLLEMEQNPDFQKQLIQKHQQFKQLFNGELITELLNQPLVSSSSSSQKSKSARRNSTQDNFNLPWNPNWPRKYTIFCPPFQNCFPNAKKTCLQQRFHRKTLYK